MTRHGRQEYLDAMTGSQSPTADASRVDSVCCSFCLKDKDSVAKLVARLAEINGVVSVSAGDANVPSD